MTTSEVKEAVRARDADRCVECGMTSAEHLAVYGKNLDVHRIVPGSKYTLEGCVTLCRHCHGPQPKRPHGEGPPCIVLNAPEVKQALRDYAEQERRSTSQAGALLLEEILTQKGFFPPQGGNAA